MILLSSRFLKIWSMSGFVAVLRELDA